jgi:hypothetical protein
VVEERGGGGVKIVGHYRRADDGGSAHGSMLEFRILWGFIIGGLEEVRWGRWRTGGGATKVVGGERGERDGDG